MSGLMLVFAAAYLFCCGSSRSTDVVLPHASVVTLFRSSHCCY